MGGGKQPRHWAPLVEALGVFLLIMGYIWWAMARWPWSWIALAALIAATHVARHEGPGRLGFGWRGFRAAFPAVLATAAALSLFWLGIGALAGTFRPTTAWETVQGVGLYILWGLVQQYLLNGYLVNRLEQFGATRGFAPGVAAALFSLAHAPNWFLMAVTLVGGYACARFYQRHRNLYVLAIAHGMVAFCLYRATPEALAVHFLVGPRYFMSHGFRI